MKKEERVFIANLIENVKKRKCLYDRRSAFYFHNKVKERAWKEIGEICNKSATDCKHRWQSLRKLFCKQLKRNEARSVGGISYLEEWRFMQPMLFLKGFLAKRRYRKKAEKQETEATFEQSTLSGDSLLEPLKSSSTPTKKSEPTLDNLCQNFGNTVENMERKYPLQQETTDDVFMQLVVCLMKDLPVNIKDDFQAGIIQEVYRLRKNYRNAYILVWFSKKFWIFVFVIIPSYLFNRSSVKLSAHLMTWLERASLKVFIEMCESLSCSYTEYDRLIAALNVKHLIIRRKEVFKIMFFS